jgi:hypothetical protein
MTHLERRENPRTAIEKHAYINIEPNNGGIVLNVSDGGLCFHTFDPVQKNGPVRFWFSDHNRRIEAFGTLAWSDETHKSGLRFTNLPPAARDKVRDWMSRPAAAVVTEAGMAATESRPRAVTHAGGNGLDSKAAPEVSAPAAMVSPQLKVRVQLSGFSRGLVTGLLLSAVVVSAVLFQSYRREFGESLIRLGERFAARPQTQAAVVTAASPAVAQTVQAPAPIPDPPPKKASPQPEKPAPSPENVVLRPLPVPARVEVAKAEPAKVEPTKVEAARPVSTPVLSAAINPAPKVAVAASAPASSSTPLAPAAISLPTSTTAAATGVNPATNRVAPSAKIENGSQPAVQTETSAADNAASTSQMFFEVGKFKNQSQAHIEMNKLSQLGFPAQAVQKGFLWSNSYHILVGPYGDEERARVTHASLVSSGFKPRPFERGSRPFSLGSLVTLNGARTPPGDYIISWESSLDDASVKLLHNDFVVASANARWVKREDKYPRDAYVYRRNADGSRTLLEIRFGGTHQALVFGKTS